MRKRSMTAASGQFNVGIKPGTFTAAPSLFDAARQAGTTFTAADQASTMAPQSAWQVLRVVKSVDDDQHFWQPDLAAAWLEVARRIGADSSATAMRYVAPKLVQLWTALGNYFRAMNLSPYAVPAYRDAWVRAYGLQPRLSERVGSVNSSSAGAIPRWVMQMLSRAGRGTPAVTIHPLIALSASAEPRVLSLDLSSPLGREGYSPTMGRVMNASEYGSMSLWDSTFWTLGVSDAAAFHDLRGSYLLGKEIADALAAQSPQTVVNEAFRTGQQDRIPWELYVGETGLPELPVPEGFQRRVDIGSIGYIAPSPGSEAPPTKQRVNLDEAPPSVPSKTGAQETPPAVPSKQPVNLDAPPNVGIDITERTPAPCDAKSLALIPRSWASTADRDAFIARAGEGCREAAMRVAVAEASSCGVSQRAMIPSAWETEADRDAFIRANPACEQLAMASPVQRGGLTPPPCTALPSLPPPWPDTATRDAFIRANPGCRMLAMAVPVQSPTPPPSFLGTWWPALAVGGAAAAGALWWKFGRSG